ncbi:Putative thiosulfate sulfurtransferase precursor [Planctomycetes bacterium Poly30]|uniref:Sulfurtransferase n=1 Tax=Saltatorellus ferox TaxID=2528018 RepID=A0A518EYG5_9BACT|nr:Putative thiosulfate sulfurtransferase precursor [Planctomycetes bacterium Poly30]
MSSSSTRASLGAIGLTATCLAFGVFWAQSPRDESLSSGAADPGSTSPWPALTEAGAEHITPSTLTERLLEGPEELVLVDVRPAAEYAAFHLPGAHSLDLVALLGAEGEALLEASAGRTVVLYSNGMVHPAQAWVELSMRGYGDVRVLEGGLAQLRDEVLTPPSLRPGYGEARARREASDFRAARELYFGPAVPAFERYATDPVALSSPTVVSTAWVERRGGAIVVLDARKPEAEYLEGHLPGAVHMPITATRGSEGPLDHLLPPAELAAVFGAAGIDENDEVVVYSGSKMQDATHLVLALRSLGHERVALMEGGIGAWVEEGRATATGKVTRPTTEYSPRATLPRIASDLESVSEASRTGNALIVDSRPAVNFSGAEDKTEARAGHVPRALHRAVAMDVAKVNGGVYFRPRAEILAGYEALGVTPDVPTISMCRTGHQASQTWFLLHEVLGFGPVTWYDGSWQEWARHDELPLETSLEN